MSKEKTNSPASPESSSEAAAKRRPAKARSGKLAKADEAVAAVVEESIVEKSAAAYPVFDAVEQAPITESHQASGSADASPQENAKRKRRRKKGKGGGGQNAAQAAMAAFSSEPTEETKAVESGTQPPDPKQIRPKLDSEDIAKLAWKIYLAEVSEEGVALIADSDAKELSRRCFRLAEIFMEEQSRRR